MLCYKCLSRSQQHPPGAPCHTECGKVCCGYFVVRVSPLQNPHSSKQSNGPAGIVESPLRVSGLSRPLEPPPPTQALSSACQFPASPESIPLSPASPPLPRLLLSLGEPGQALPCSPSDRRRPYSPTAPWPRFCPFAFRSISSSRTWVSTQQTLASVP